MKMLLGKFVPDCVRSNLRGSKFEILLGEGGAPIIILLPSCSPPPTPQLKILVYETLICHESPTPVGIKVGGRLVQNS